ncbi:response regulator [Sulfitobacter donghicola]|uniref:Chemotaxis protein CheY n=1 Tax=Sulfitobacter donghicola DSW-25 = KCTC 12864 = JCM 14565 TaxID=1300350 RepID=A0A073IT51_9RHOB|nr:response regulator [Sulfitobacter donghicola]KEJ88547.1 chemotaxis protein CheY [Sulfitobacter donghicola DSW-25 = KCTC 12864 = JCM 14565]KIN69567.1 putative two-component response regulator protein [Sulfitobacter donghicola DSW-25 = KCTC 12864 = JCM 14565]
MSDQTVLVVDDDKKVRNLLRNVLEGDGFSVLEAETGAQLMEHVASSELSLITLDIHLGSDNGIELAREIRHVSQVPIIMLTGKDDVIDRVVGLEVGADDYITKPFHVREVIARIRSVLRRSEVTEQAHKEETAPQKDAPKNAESQRYIFDGMTAIPDQLELLDRSGLSCGLTSGDFKLLSVFLTRPKRVLSRDQLMDLTGGTEWHPLDRAIDNQIARLRKKIERDPSVPKLIKTVRGVGYTFAQDVQVVT